MKFFLTLTAITVRAEEYFIKEIGGMLENIAPGYGIQELYNYGCTGRGALDPSSKNAGDPVDSLDRLINHWKQCRRCANNYYESSSSTSSYIFDIRTERCRDEEFSLNRSTCECDYLFARAASRVEIQPQHQNMSIKKCSKRRSRFRPNHGCCQSRSGAFAWYNADLKCCDTNGRLKPIGQC